MENVGNNNSINIENYAIPVVYNPDFKPFDVRSAEKKVYELGRPLTNDELKQFEVY